MVLGALQATYQTRSLQVLPALFGALGVQTIQPTVHKNVNFDAVLKTRVKYNTVA